MPTIEHLGVSRKIESSSERGRLRTLIQRIRAEEDVPSGGFIVRTAGIGIAEEDLRLASVDRRNVAVNRGPQDPDPHRHAGAQAADVAGDALRHGLFQAASNLSTTGFVTTGYAQWPGAAPLMLVFMTLFYASLWFTFADCFSPSDPVVASPRDDVDPPDPLTKGSS